MAQELTAEVLRELVTYDAETGRFNWLAPRPHCRPGETAGGFDKDGYWRVGLFGKQHCAHRLAWLYVHGEWPQAEPDHINMVRADNRILGYFADPMEAGDVYAAAARAIYGDFARLR